MLQIACNNVIAKLLGADPAVRASIADLLSFEVEDAHRNPGYQIGVWSGKSTFLRADNTFEAGFLGMIRRHLAERGDQFIVHDFRPKVTPADLNKDIATIIPGITLYDYQVEAILAFLREMRVVIKVATGGGKTEIAIAAAMLLGLPTLFLTNQADLVEQTKERFERALGRKVGVVSEGEFQPSLITVASVQTIAANQSIWWRIEGEGRPRGLAGDPIVPMAKTIKASDQAELLTLARGRGFEKVSKLEVQRDNAAMIDQFLAGIQFLIVDEAHMVSGDTFFRICGGCINATYRMCLSATPLMREKKEDNLKLTAVGGDIVTNITIKELIARGVLAQPYFHFYEVPPAPGIKPATPYAAAYKAGIVNHDVRNALGLEAAYSLREHKPLVLVQNKEHGKKLLEWAKLRGWRTAWVSGNDKAGGRRPLLNRLRDGELDFLIASTIFDQGVDERSIGAIVLLGGNKAEIKTYQRTGRAGRRKDGDRDQVCHIVDFLDTGNKHLEKHAKRRFQNVKEEDGWIIEKVVPWDPSIRQELLRHYVPQASIPVYDPRAALWAKSPVASNTLA